jgi:hypothetical protein
MPYTEREEVNDLLRVFAEHMGSEDSIGRIFDQDFERGVL